MVFFAERRLLKVWLSRKEMVVGMSEGLNSRYVVCHKSRTKRVRSTRILFEHFLFYDLFYLSRIDNITIEKTL